MSCNHVIASLNSKLANAVAAKKTIGSHGKEQGAVDHEHSWRANAAREISANEASQRHPASKRNHINTHDSAAQFVGGNQLHE